MSVVPLVSSPIRLDALESKATYLPSFETAEKVLLLFACVPLLDTLILVVLGAASAGEVMLATATVRIENRPRRLVGDIRIRVAPFLDGRTRLLRRVWSPPL
jgi:hypothetical protein